MQVAKIKLGTMFLAATFLGTVGVNSGVALADITTTSSPNSNVTVLGGDADFSSTGGIDPNDPIIGNSGDIKYISNEAILNYMAINSPTEYKNMPNSLKQEILAQDEIRQGTTKYVKLKNGHYKIYIAPL
ncbi:hypothetical protein EQG49_06515 [Periweissella cryptocerci]|uniref:Uncharacterized protein n=1 Tax=Periweissella cryptocerci TaxID=2506420 RepID=A0A4V1AIN6_9LACO|nr:hypothetical protein [Periweissella cryptocerci]QBO36135.1 hypothetical protein EQG49_06515 [Periweissella cryptocerci]